MNVQIFGITASISWLSLILVAIFSFDAFLYIKRVYEGQATFAYLLVGFLAALGIIVSVLIHEFSHAIVASLFGIKIVGAGISWWGGYVDSGAVTMPPMTGLLVCLAGPMANAVLGGLASFIVFCRGESLFENAVQYFALINFKLALFNMVPIGGLDGQKVLTDFNQIVFGGSHISYWIMAVPLMILLFIAKDAVRDWLRKL